LRAPAIQVSAQFLTAGSGGIARCARLTLQALAGEARLSALAVEDREPTQIGKVRTRPFSGNRAAFVAGNLAGGLKSDWVIYDFAGTARAHAPLALAGKPYAVWAHGVEVWPGQLRPDYERAIRGAKAVFVNSRHTLARLNESIPGLASTELCLLGTEADAGACDTPPPSGPREPMVLFVGRNDDDFAKGQDVLIDVWPDVVARAPDAVLCFVGGGERLDRLRQLAATSPASASIRVLGALSDAEVAALYRRARLFAMLSEIEGFGLVFVEAMSHGLPVLTSTEDASPEVNREGETGFSVSRAERGRIASVITDVLTQDQLLERLSRNAHALWKERYCFSAFRERFLAAAARAGMLTAAGPVGADVAEAAR
jgi:phosphatidylinositol alpha-1,6-mannosyltransferase